MAHGLKKHLKRLKAPKKWALSKLDGIFAPKLKSGPHKKENSYPLSLILRNKLKYAVNTREVIQILSQKIVYVDGKIRTQKNYPIGIMDIILIKKTKEIFRLLYNSIGSFTLHRIGKNESFIKICKVISVKIGNMGIPYIVTHDGRTIRYPDPVIKTNDSVIFNIFKKKIIDFIKFDIGSLCIVTGGYNTGKIGIVYYKEKYYNSQEMIYLKNFEESQFFTKISNVFVIGKGNKSFISLPKKI
nr:40S ribosomal protein S4 [Cryptomonas paramecium]